MKELPVGQIIDANQQRDAIHVAVAPVIAGERLVPGAHIGFVKDGDTEHVGVRCQTLLGVVDPFLTGFVNYGERFWMFLYPQTITSLRHDWTHPAFEVQAPAVSEKAQSEQWLRAFAEEVGVSYGALLEAADIAMVRGYGTVLNYDTPDVVYTKKDEAWKHYEIVTGKALSDKDRDAAMFSCSC